MHISITRAAMAAAVLSFGVTVANSASTDLSAAPAGAYKVAPAHTQVVFSIMHMGLSPYYGRFGTVSGDLTFNPQAPEKSSVNITIQMNSVNTPHDKLTVELCTEGTFNCAQFPTATFKSTGLRRSGNTGEITGDLTLAGVTKPVTLRVKFHGGVKRQDTGAYVLGFSGSTTVKRSDFGLTKMRWASFVGDEVELLIEAEFAQDQG